MKKINWGIIGCGDVTEKKSGPAFNKVPNSSLVAVMRRDGAKAADYARRHGVPRWYADANQLINDPVVNAIYISTPPSSHEAYSIAAMNAGKSVYVEKPMALNYTAAKNMATMSAAKHIKMVVAHYRREQPFFKKVKQLLDEKAIGDIRFVKLEFCRSPFSKEDLAIEQNAWRVDPAISGGGIFHDLAPHQIDLMLYFFGPVEKVNGIANNQARSYQADDMVAGNILFKNGIAFSGSWCFNAFAYADHCEITGSEGKISFSVFNKAIIHLATKASNTNFTFELLQHVQQPMIERTVQYFLGEGPNPCSGEEGAEVMRLMEAFVNR
ncbi:MAG: Gfo/Idh/MocA family oxidoreductase [Ferruginibacter sp.]